MFTMSSGVITAVATGAVSNHEFCQLGAQCFRFRGRSQLQSRKVCRHEAALDSEAREFVVQTMSCAPPRVSPTERLPMPRGPSPALMPLSKDRHVALHWTHNDIAAVAQ
jgi:hypothetical protein